jgi:hypothetical protein
MSPWLARSSLFLVLVLAASVRVHGLRFGVPVRPEPDAFVVEHVTRVRAGGAAPDRTFAGAQYPSLLADLTLLLPAPEDDPQRLARMELDLHLRNAALPYLQVRGVVAVLGLLVVPATYLVARAFLSGGWSVLAAAFAAGSLLLVNLGQTARPHAALAALTTLAVAAALRLRRDPGPASHVLAGVAAALALGCLHTGALALAPLAAALVLARADVRARRAGWTLVPLLLPLLAAPWFYRHIYDPAVVVAGAGGAAHLDHEPITFRWWLAELWYHFDGNGLGRIARSLATWEPVLGALALCAAALALADLARGRLPERERRMDLLVVAAFALPYAGLLAGFGKTYERFLTPLIPFLACAAAWLASRVWERAGARRGLVLAASLAALGAAWLPALQLARLRARPDTLDEAARWIAEHARPGETVVLAPPVDLALARTPAALCTAGDRQPALFSPWAVYQADLPGGGVRGLQHELIWMGERAGMGDLDGDAALADYVDFYGPGLFVFELERERKHRWYRRIRERVAQLGTLQARLSPDRDPCATDLGLGVQDRDFPDRPAAAWRTLRARASGPVLEIWRIDDDAHAHLGRGELRCSSGGR